MYDVISYPVFLISKSDFCLCVPVYYDEVIFNDNIKTLTFKVRKQLFIFLVHHAPIKLKSLHIREHELNKISWEKISEKLLPLD